MLFEQRVKLKEDTHQYFHSSGEEYGSASSLLDTLEEKFDREGISRAMAVKEAKELGISVDQAQDAILSKWNTNLEFSQDTGNFIHDNLESNFKTGICDPRVKPAADSIARFLKDYYRFYPELVLYNEKYKKAGMSDLIVQRTRSKKSVMDVFDYKTNTSKGIYFDTAKRNEKGRVEKFYNKFFLSPLEHLEASNYNRYALQMSIYGHMLEMLTGRKIGRLGLLFVDHLTMEVTMYPVPYLKFEVHALFESNSFLKPLPAAPEATWED